MWNRVGVQRGNIVLTAVVSTGAPVTVAIGNHMKRRGPRARRRTHEAHVEKFVKLSFGGYEFLGREAAWSCKDRAAFRDNVMSNVVFNRGITGQGVFNDGKSSGSCLKGLSMDGDAVTELMREVRPGEESASTRVPFRVSRKRLFSRSTTNLCRNRKSVPTIGWLTSAKTNFQVRGRGSPKSRVNCLKP